MQFWFQTSHQCMPILTNMPKTPSRLKYTKRYTPMFNQMLKRMWSGDLTKDDRVRINSRVISTPGLELLPDFEGKQIQTEFSKLEKTVVTHAM